MKSLAIIGTGIAAMGAAHFLKDHYDLTLYEKNNYPGGHTNTLTIDEDGTPVYIDSAFMVYNEYTYPNLTRLFSELQVATKPTDMSFSVQYLASGLEYCGTGLSGLFAQRKNVLSPAHWSLLLEIHRFNTQALELLETDQYLDLSLDEYVKMRGYSRHFVDKFLVPISSAVWSTPPDLMLKFPAVTLVRFFKNHGFLGLRGHYQWRTVVEGSQRYREKLLTPLRDRIRLNDPVRSVRRERGQAIVVDSRGDERAFDKVILASHADESLTMLTDATSKEREILSKFRYQPNRAVLHTDASIMPREKRAWSSWNYRIGDQQPTTIYWMNQLQHVSNKKNYFISINDPGDVDPAMILWEAQYTHPVFDVPAIRAQSQLADLNQNGSVYFCGGYFKYGFHEDALTSGLAVARTILGSLPWD